MSAEERQRAQPRNVEQLDGAGACVVGAARGRTAGSPAAAAAAAVHARADVIDDAVDWIAANPITDARREQK